MSLTYDAHRFLYNNLIDDAADITPNTQATGIVATFSKTQGEGGAAVLYASGDYSGTADRTIWCQIDSIAAGDDIGNATFRYRYDTTAAGAWESSGISTSTSAVSVGDGVSVRWVSSGGTDFVVGDTWTIEVKATYGPGKLIDLNRETVWRSTDFTDEDILTNGDFEDGFTAGLADDWSKLGAAQTFAEETTTVHTAGGSAQKITCADDGQQMGIRQSITLTAGAWSYISVWVYQNSERTFQIDCANIDGSSESATIPATTWTQLTWASFATSGGAVNLDIRQAVGDCTIADYVIIDDIQCWPCPTITIDLGSAQQCTALVMLDHNFSDSAVVYRQANASDAWTSPSVNESVTVRSPIIEYFDTTYRYRRYVMIDPDNTDGYNEIGNLFLGTYLELTKRTVKGTPYGYEYVIQQQTIGNNDTTQYAQATQRQFPLNFPRYIGNTDVENLVTMQEALIDLTTHTVSPFFFHYMYGTPESLALVRWIDIGQFKQLLTGPALNTITVNFVEIPKRGV
jgi:hypothetical protein